ncbi:sensor histidine kinase [Emticicia agri]|uniref:Histidine kinase n=1 Tax=Emticicia agri TaxID=2492393 RepID=A0A4Q5LT86_9BACT|nr:sensor histidine kinase [Emticicia agri]RYU92707.1 histidine kinase [Emticicia agri]
MKKSDKSKIEIDWIREMIFFWGFFILMSLSHWNFLSSVDEITEGFLHFLILYTFAIAYRVFVFPLFTKGHFSKFLFFTVVVLVSGGVFLFVADYFYFYPEFHQSQSWLKMVLLYIVNTAVSLITMEAIFLLEYFYRQQIRSTNQMLQLSEAQTKLLQAQLNPHFLFNTLNNLYGISIQEPARMPVMIMQLSQLMRYQVESASKQQVKLSEEITYLNSYIHLEKERIGLRCTVTYQYPKPIESLLSYQIVPLLLLPLIENAFKHSSGSIKSCFVSINISMSGSVLTLDILNSIPVHRPKLVSTGFGIPNTKKRLEAFYSGLYELELEEINNHYKTRLTLDLNPNTHG